MSVSELPPECSNDITDCEVLQGLCFMNQSDLSVDSVAQVWQALSVAACTGCKRQLKLSGDESK